MSEVEGANYTVVYKLYNDGKAELYAQAVTFTGEAFGLYGSSESDTIVDMIRHALKDIGSAMAFLTLLQPRVVPVPNGYLATIFPDGEPDAVGLFEFGMSNGITILGLVASASTGALMSDMYDVGIPLTLTALHNESWDEVAPSSYDADEFVNRLLRGYDDEEDDDDS